MPTNSREASEHLARLLKGSESSAVLQRLQPRHEPLPPRIPGATLVTPEAIARRWKLLSQADQARDVLLPADTALHGERYRRNIENFIGVAQVPIGLCGPLRVNGTAALGDFYVPLATTEAALVASYHRGTVVISESGGSQVVVLAEGVSRAPGFAFLSLREAGSFVAWALEQREAFAAETATTTRHGKLIDMRVTIEGNHVYLNFEFLTGDASGQNMVTIATDAICAYIERTCPVRAEYFFVEANLSGDKKASAQSFQNVRGRKVSAEVLVPAAIIARRLHTTARQMERYWRMSALGGVLSGTIGVQGHYANGLAALFLATGQDVACVSEAAVGVTRFEACEDGSLYAAVTLPNLIMGTVGGGTSLPTAAACLDILGLRGTGHAAALAEVTAALALAGELSIIGALSAGQFTRAHAKLARPPAAIPE